ncbi:unnamed protein product, partial [Owenia fusiformis]
MTRWYSNFLARFYWLVVIIITVCVAICAFIVFYLHGTPSFEDPIKGFEVRGTSLSKRLNAMREFQKQVGLTNGNYTYQPKQVGISRRKKRDIQQVQNFCYRISQDGSVQCPTVISLGATNDGDLFTKHSLQSVCKIHLALAKHPAYITESHHSLPHYMEQLFDTTCDDFTDSMVEQMKTLLTKCVPFYKDNQLDANCENGQCIAPGECNTNNTIYQIFHYLVDRNFLRENGKGTLKYTNLFTHTWLAKNMDFYRAYFDGQDFEIDGVMVMGLYMEGLKNDLFSEYLVSDIMLFGVALGLIFIVMFLYLKSLLIMFATLLNVAFSFIIAYFLYFVIFRFTFFPFLNIFAGLILIAVGADDVFVYFDIWHEMKRKMEGGKKRENEKKVGNDKREEDDKIMENGGIKNKKQMESKSELADTTDLYVNKGNLQENPNASIPNETNVQEIPDVQIDDTHLRLLIHNTLKHATLSIFVTSFTTAAAFFANFSSNIIATRCFGIFAGTCILVNFIFMVTWMPAIFIIVEKIDQNLLSGVKCCECWDRFLNGVQTLSRVVFTRLIPTLVIEAWFFWCILLSAVGIAGIILVFIIPKLNLPTSKEFQILPSSNPLEKYTILKLNFDFENTEQGERGQYVFIYWGILATDNGNWLDPDDNGTLQLDSTFNLYSLESRAWMVKFCKKLLQQDFIEESFANSTKCSLEVIDEYLSMNCSTQGAVQNCCGKRLPVNSTIFEYCFPRLALFGFQYVGSGLFDSSNNVPVYFMMVQTIQPFVPAFAETNNLFNKVNGFVENEVKSAPKGLNEGWVGGSFDFYSLQRSIAYGTYTTMGIAIAVAFIVMLLTSLNIFITVYAIVTITFGIAATVGVLVLLGWELNILESAIISLAVGFSIDFTIHYGVAYRLSHEAKRISKVTDSFHMIGSAVAMAAFTTFIAGAAIMPARILGYQRLGVFLMLVMTFSWIYATFFFQSLCRIIGPLGNVGSLLACCVKIKIDCEKEEVSTPVISIGFSQNTQPLPGENTSKHDETKNETTDTDKELAKKSTNETVSNIDVSVGSLPYNPSSKQETRNETSEDAPQRCSPNDRGKYHISEDKKLQRSKEHVSIVPVQHSQEDTLATSVDSNDSTHKSPNKHNEAKNEIPESVFRNNSITDSPSSQDERKNEISNKNISQISVGFEDNSKKE